jgi:hypothetical protein
MTTAYILDFEGGTVAQYDEVLKKMQLGGRLPAGALFHAAGVTDDGLRVCDVWESEESFQAFAGTKIVPITEEMGLPKPEIRSFEAAQVRGGGDGPVEFVQVVTIPGLDGATFSALDDRVLAPSSEVPEACVFHVNGKLGDDWCVLDYWSSKAARDEFMASRVGPAVAAAGITTEPHIEELSVHNSLTQQATASV